MHRLSYLTVPRSRRPNSQRRIAAANVRLRTVTPGSERPPASGTPATARVSSHGTKQLATCSENQECLTLAAAPSSLAGKPLRLGRDRGDSSTASPGDRLRPSQTCRVVGFWLLLVGGHNGYTAMMSRREFVGVLAGATCGVARVPSLAAQDDELSRTRGGLPWLREAQGIVSRIRIPTFPDRTISGLEAGGKPDGVTDCRAKFQSVIDQLNAAGGGQLSLPSGTWLSNGPLHLKSNVRLHLSAEARLEFSGSPEHYLPVVLTRWEGTEVYGPSPLIYAYQSVNLAVTGSGVIVGHGGEVFDTWREKQADDQQLLRKMGAEGVAVHERTFGAGHFLRPVMMQFFACRNVLVDGIALTDMPFWGIHPVFSHSVTIRGVRIVATSTVTVSTQIPQRTFSLNARVAHG